MFERVDDAVRVVVGGVDHPLIPSMWVRDEFNPVGDLIIHVEVGGSHIHLEAEGGSVLFELAQTHVVEELGRKGGRKEEGEGRGGGKRVIRYNSARFK